MAPFKLVKENGTTKDGNEGSSPRKPVPSSTNRTHRPHPRPPRRPDDPAGPHRPSSSNRRRDPNRPPSRDKERDRHRERRERPPPGDPSRRSTRPRSNSESSIPVERAHRTRDIKDGHIHKPRSSRPHKDDKKDGKTSSSSKGRLHPVDKIDLLDVTGLYGPGCISLPFLSKFYLTLQSSIMMGRSMHVALIGINILIKPRSPHSLLIPLPTPSPADWAKSPVSTEINTLVSRPEKPLKTTVTSATTRLPTKRTAPPPNSDEHQNRKHLPLRHPSAPSMTLIKFGLAWGFGVPRLTHV